MKQKISYIVRFMISFCMISLCAKGQITYQIENIGDYEYIVNLSSGDFVCTDYLGSDDVITIPKTVLYQGETHEVKEVGHDGSGGFTNLSISKVNIPQTFVKGAFKACGNLTEVVFQGSSVWAYPNCFRECPALTKFVLERNIGSVYIDLSFDQNTRLQEVWSLNPIPPKMNYFGNQWQATLYVPAGCKQAYEMSESNWKKFKNIVEIGEEQEGLVFVYNGIRYQVISAQAVMVLGAESVVNGKVSLPPTVPYKEKEYSVTTINAGAFSNSSNLSGIDLPNTLIRIGGKAFQSCSSLKSIIIPASVTSLDNDIFDNCTSLETIDVATDNDRYCSENGILYSIGDTKTLIVYPVNHSQETYNMPDRVYRIYAKALHGCKNLKKLVFSDNLKQIPEELIAFCPKLVSVTLPWYLENQNVNIFGPEVNTLKEIHCKTEMPPSCSDNIFDNINQSNVILYVPSNTARKHYKVTSPWSRVKLILKEGERIAFTLANLSYGYVSEIDHTIKVSTCCDHMVSHLEIPETIEQDGIVYTVIGIGEGAFDGCTHINTITLPATLKEIDDMAFANCTGLTAIHFKATQHPVLGNNVFENVNLQKITAYVPKGYKKHYTDWGIFANVVEEDNGGGTIEPGSVFTDETGLFQCSVLPDNTVSVTGPHVEAGSIWTVTEFTIPATVSYGGKRYNLTTIGESAFFGCDKLTKIILPEGLKTISKNAFKGCTALTSIDIPASVETIGQYAFDMDEKLTQVTLHEGLKEIGEGAFDECGVKEITIPASVTLLGSMEDGWNDPDIGILERINIQPNNTVYASVDGILYNKAKTILMLCPTEYPVKSVTLPAGLVRIVDNAMAHCEFIESLVLPEGLEVIEEGAFEYCEALKSITIPSTLKEMGGYLFGTPYTEDDVCALLEIHSNHKTPANIKMTRDPLATIDKNICKLYVPKGTKTLYAAAPGWKDFKNIVEEGGMTAVSFTIGQLQYKVTAANEVMITGVTDKTPEYFDIKPSVTYEGTTYNVTALGDRAFDDCRNLVRFQPERVKMPLKTIGKEAFRGCEKLTNLLLGSALETIGEGAFMKCSSLQNLEIPAGVTSIGEGVFDECGKLANIAVNSANQYYTSSNGVLYNKNRTTLFVYPNMRGDSYSVPNGVKRIENGAFYYCTNLKLIVLPDGLESIGDYAFDFCTGLKSLTLPASLKSIGLGIVDHCGNTLEEIHSKMVKPLSLGDYPEYAFFYYGDKSDICVLYVPKGSKEDYLKADGWKAFKNIKEEGEGFEPDIEEVTDSTLTITWEPVQEATDYILKIYRDAAKTELIATYTFDANGQMKSTGFSYQLKGLEAGSTYYIETTAVKKVGSETIILVQTTTAAKTTGTSVGNMEITVDKPLIRVADGQLWIQSSLETNVKVYNLSGYCVYAKQISGVSSFRLSAGIYIVLIGDECYKIAIR